MMTKHLDRYEQLDLADLDAVVGGLGVPGGGHAAQASRSDGNGAAGGYLSLGGQIAGWGGAFTATAGNDGIHGFFSTAKGLSNDHDGNFGSGAGVSLGLGGYRSDTTTSDLFTGAGHEVNYSVDELAALGVQGGWNEHGEYGGVTLGVGTPGVNASSSDTYGYEMPRFGVITPEIGDGRDHSGDVVPEPTDWSSSFGDHELAAYNNNHGDPGLHADENDHSVPDGFSLDYNNDHGPDAHDGPGESVDGYHGGEATPGDHGGDYDVPDGFSVDHGNDFHDSFEPGAGTHGDDTSDHSGESYAADHVGAGESYATDFGGGNGSHDSEPGGGSESYAVASNGGSESYGGEDSGSGSFGGGDSGSGSDSGSSDSGGSVG